MLNQFVIPPSFQVIKLSDVVKEAFNNNGDVKAKYAANEWNIELQRIDNSGLEDWVFITKIEA